MKKPLLLAILIIPLFIAALVYFIKILDEAKKAAWELVCHCKFDCLGCIDIYTERNRSFPEFKDNSGKETWSWRIIIPLYDDDDFRNRVNLNLPWYSEYNRELLDNSIVPDFFACAFIVKNNKKAAQVAVRGEGTLWTEVNKNPQLLDCNEQIKDKIIAIEIANPVNEWYEPGDDVSPDIVLEMYRKYRNNQYESPHKRIYFLTMGGTNEFANVKSESELLSRLYVNKVKKNE